MHIRAEVACQEEIRKELHPELQTGTRTCYVKLEFALLMDCLKPGCIKRTHVGVGLMFFQQFKGIGAIIYYSPALIQGMSLNSELSLIMSGVLNVIHLLGVCPSLFTMDKFGRRSLLFGGSLFMWATVFTIGGVQGIFFWNLFYWESSQVVNSACVTLLLLYMLAFGATWVCRLRSSQVG